MAAGGEFVEGWLVAQVLGEGAYGEVRLLVHARTGAAVALKVVRREAGGAAESPREAALHRALRHRHVLRCLGERDHQGLHYVFLEYAQGGELFDRIEPDAGMPERAARRYWGQLLAGLRYLHGRGVAHRDIKPENLLLDRHDDLKISDFGMATLFRHGSRERLLTRVCGTVPYAAPEVLLAAERPYRAPPADLWAAAIVLLAMLAGELPWERARPTDARYAAWCAWVGAGAGEPPGGAGGPWRKLGGAALALVRRALRPDPARRPPLAALLTHRWMRDPETESASRAWHSQPPGGAGAGAGAEGGDNDAAAGDLSPADMDALISYSQPTAADDVLLGSGTTGVGAAGVAGLAGLARRLPRVWVRGAGGAGGEAARALAAALRSLGLAWRRARPRELAVECGGGVHMRAWLVRSETRAGAERTLVEFRRARGCGLQFKRRFAELRAALQPFAADSPPPSPVPERMDDS